MTALTKGRLRDRVRTRYGEPLCTEALGKVPASTFRDIEQGLCGKISWWRHFHKVHHLRLEGGGGFWNSCLNAKIPPYNVLRPSKFLKFTFAVVSNIVSSYALYLSFAFIFTLFNALTCFVCDVFVLSRSGPIIWTLPSSHGILGRLVVFGQQRHGTAVSAVR